MPKEIKRCYNFMNLSYSSTVEEVKEQEGAMIKAMQDKAMKNNKSFDDKINKIIDSSKNIIEYIEKNGVSNKKDNLFSTSNTSIFSLLIMLFAVVMVLGFLIYSLI